MALAASAGISRGALIHSALARAGLAAVIAASPPVFAAIRWIGPAYLLFLAGRMLISGSGSGSGAEAPRRPPHGLRGPLSRG